MFCIYFKWYFISGIYEQYNTFKYTWLYPCPFGQSSYNYIIAIGRQVDSYKYLMMVAQHQIYIIT